MGREMTPNALGSEKLAIAGVIDPDAYTADTYETGWISMADREQILAQILVGTMGTNATVDAKLEQAQDDGGTNAKDITGKAITQLTQAGTDDSDKQAQIDCRSEELDVEGGFTHVRLSVTIGTAAVDLGATVLGLHHRYGPASDHNLASVAESVN